MASGQTNPQYDSEGRLYEDEQPGVQVQRDARQPGNVGYAGGQPGVDPGNTAASTVPGQQIDRTQMAQQQGYVNPTGRSTMPRHSPSLSVSARAGSTLDPNVDYFNRRVKGVDTKKLHRIISQYAGTFNAGEFIENISYQGFNRSAYVMAALNKMTVSQFSRLAVMGAIRGSNFAKIQGNSLKVDEDLIQLMKDGVIVKTPKRKDDVSILRCTASIPQWCAYFMMQASVPPKLADSDLPTFLQFPAAASLPMSTDLRKKHIEFSIKFSQLIGGTFNPNIYMAAFNNQLPLSEIPDTLRMQLGVQSESEGRTIQAQTMIKELSSALIKAP